MIRVVSGAEFLGRYRAAGYRVMDRPMPHLDVVVIAKGWPSRLVCRVRRFLRNPNQWLGERKVERLFEDLTNDFEAGRRAEYLRTMPPLQADDLL